MIDEKDLVRAIELRQRIAKRNNQGFVDLPHEMVSNILDRLKEQEPSPVEERVKHYGKIYKCPRCKVEYYLQTQRFCQQCGRAVRF